MATAAAYTYIETIRRLPAGSTLVVPDVPWDGYEALVAELQDDSSVRISYDDGILEIVSPSTKHEKYERFIEAVAFVLASELGMDLESFGSATFKRQAAKRGVEPDACFYVQHAADVIGKDAIDLDVDPAPDVMVEIDVSHSSLRKRAIYAVLGVPELWRYDGKRAVMYRLEGAEYVEIAGSLAFPALTAHTLTALLSEIKTKGRQTVLNTYRESLRTGREG